MYWKILDDEHPARKTLISLAAISAITTASNNPTKIKIHLTCGKEFRADEECLDEPVLIDLDKLLKSRATFNT